MQPFDGTGNVSEQDQADRAYDSDALHHLMAERGAWADIRAMPNRVKTFPFSKWLYRRRNAVRTVLQQIQTLPSHRKPDTTSGMTTSSLPSASGSDLLSR